MVPRKRGDLLSEETDSRVVVVDRSSGVVHELSDTAAFIWRQIDGQRSASTIASRVLDCFEVEPAVAAADVNSFIERLRELDLVDLA